MELRFPRLFAALLVLAAALISCSVAYATTNTGFGPELSAIAATITAITASVLLGYLSAVVVPVGSSMRSRAEALVSDGHPDAALSVYGPALEILGWVLVVGAITCGTIAVVLTGGRHSSRFGSSLLT